MDLDVKSNLDYYSKTQIIHESIIPAEILKGENIFAKVKFNNSEKRFDVYRISPLGIELNDEDNYIKENDKIDLELNIANQKILFKDINVSFKENSKCGFKFNNKFEDNENKLFDCNLDYIPTIVTYNPLKFKDQIYFRVKSISGFSMEIVTSLRNKNLIPGMSFESEINFPTIGVQKLNLKIKNSQIIIFDEKEFLCLYVDIISNNFLLKENIGKYILKFCSNLDIKDFRENKLNIYDTNGIVNFSLLTTKEEFEEVLELRKLAYSSSSKIENNEQLNDNCDDYSKVIIGKYKGKIVASLRIIDLDSDKKAELEYFINLEKKFPERNQIVEVSRFCVHPQFKRSDLFSNLVRHLGLYMFQSNKRYILSSATSDLFPLYKRIGAKKTGIDYTHNILGNKKHIVFLIDVHKVVAKVKSIDPFSWNIIFSELVDFLYKNTLVNLKLIDKLRLYLVKLLKPISNKIAYNKRVKN